MVAATDLERFRWGRFKRQDETSQETARRDVQEIARAISTQSIILERGAVIEELEDRNNTIFETLWPEEGPEQGYELHSSLGAYVIAKMAVSMVPAGQISLRHEPLKREGVLDALAEHQVEVPLAISVMGDWEVVSPGFKADRAGVATSVLAGLAERTLTRSERALALSQVAYSGRCLARLAATLNLISTVRALLPLLPSEKVGPEVMAAIAGMVLGRPERVLELFAEAPQELHLKTLVELARSLQAFHQGGLPQLDDDEQVSMPAFDAVNTSFADEEADEVTQMRPHPNQEASEEETFEDTTASGEDAEGDDEGDVLEIVEEQVDPEYQEPRVEEEPQALLVPKIPAWGREEGTVDVGLEPLLQDWMQRLNELGRVSTQTKEALGMTLPALRTGLPPVPPDGGVLANIAAEEAVNDQTERISIAQFAAGAQVEQVLAPLWPPVRGALRAVLVAVQGRAPSPEAIEKGGDLAWVLQRSRALALVITGELEQACAAVEGLSENAAPEGRWAQDRLRRFEGRRQEPVPPEEARSVAADIVADLIQQLAGTISGAARLA